MAARREAVSAAPKSKLFFVSGNLSDPIPGQWNRLVLAECVLLSRFHCMQLAPLVSKEESSSDINNGFSAPLPSLLPQIQILRLHPALLGDGRTKVRASQNAAEGNLELEMTSSVKEPPDVELGDLCKQKAEQRIKAGLGTSCEHLSPKAKLRRNFSSRRPSKRHKHSKWNFRFLNKTGQSRSAEKKNTSRIRETSESEAAIYVFPTRVLL